MRWTERQRAMLREMGIALWAPEAAPTPDEQAVVAPPRAPTGAASAPARAEAGAAMGPATRAGAGEGAVASSPVLARAPASASQRRVETAAPTARMPGLAPADWLVVAEPLDDGDPQQQQLLDNMLRAIGLALVAPNRERRAVFCAISAAAATAPTRASDDPALQTAIATAAPRCILAFGRAAAATLLGDDAPLGGLRGRVHAHAGVPVVVTFSLPFLLRHPAEKAKAWADLCLAVASLAAAPAP